MYSYIDLLAFIGVGSAHPGGFALTKQLLHRLPIQTHTRVLDAGCGTGRTAVYIANMYHCHVTGIDNHPLMLEKAKRRMEKEGAVVEWVHGSIEQLPFPNEHFSLIISESVVAFTNIEKTLLELHRVLQSGGTVILIEMTVERPLSAGERESIGNVYGTKKILTETEWLEQLGKAGFSHVEVAGGGTIAQHMFAHVDQPEWDISPQIDPSLYVIWAQHEATIRTYSHLLGYRIFVCSQ